MSSNQAPAPADDPVLREALKRCSPATYYAACKFRASGDPQDLQTVVLGVVERFVERDLRAKLQAPDELRRSLRMSQDLGLDSLTMMEIVMLAEEVLPISITNEELTKLSTFGHVVDFIATKARAQRNATAPAPSPAVTDDWDVAATGEAVRALEVRAATLPAPLKHLNRAQRA